MVSEEIPLDPIGNQNGSVRMVSEEIHLVSLKTHLKFHATTNVSPQLWQATNGILMTNDVADTNPEEAVHYFALSKNDSYVMSTSAGKISLSNMMTFKVTFDPNIARCLS
ncbi:hypothetical protein CsatB_018808 [Cannabis sativa]